MKIRLFPEHFYRFRLLDENAGNIQRSLHDCRPCKEFQADFPNDDVCLAGLKDALYPDGITC